MGDDAKTTFAEDKEVLAGAGTTPEPVEDDGQEEAAAPPSNHLDKPAEPAKDAKAEEQAEELSSADMNSGKTPGNAPPPNHLDSETGVWREAGKGPPETYDAESLKFERTDGDGNIVEVSYASAMADPQTPAMERELFEIALTRAREQGLDQAQTQAYLNDINSFRRELAARQMGEFVEVQKGWHADSRKANLLTDSSVRLQRIGLKEIDDPDGGLARALQDTGLYAHPGILRLLEAVGRMNAPGSGASKAKETSSGARMGEGFTPGPGYLGSTDRKLTPQERLDRDAILFN